MPCPPPLAGMSVEALRAERGLEQEGGGVIELLHQALERAESLSCRPDLSPRLLPLEPLRLELFGDELGRPSPADVSVRRPPDRPPRMVVIQSVPSPLPAHPASSLCYIVRVRPDRWPQQGRKARR